MARHLNRNGSKAITGRSRLKMTRITSPDTSRSPAGAATRRPPAVSMLRLAGICAWLTLLAGSPAMAQSGALASIQAQINRYGCNLPQYATSVAACRQLHARARAARSGAPAAARRSPYPSSSYRSTTRQPRVESRSGLFSGLFGAPDPDRYRRRSPGNSTRDYYYSPAPSAYGGYRTLCVRMCDGYYFPISYRASSGQLRKDAGQCESSCGVPAKLFYHHNPGGSVEGMVDLEGNRYANLENAFRYRKEYVSSCRCTPQPWSEAAKEEYIRRAEIEANPQMAEQEKTDAPVTAQAAPQAQPYAVPASSRGKRRRKRSWDSFLPFGRWTSGG